MPGGAISGSYMAKLHLLFCDATHFWVGALAADTNLKITVFRAEITRHPTQVWIIFETSFVVVFSKQQRYRGPLIKCGNQQCRPNLECCTCFISIYISFLISVVVWRFNCGHLKISTHFVCLSKVFPTQGIFRFETAFHLFR